MWQLIDSKGRVCLEHECKAYIEFWAFHEWKMSDYQIVKVTK